VVARETMIVGISPPTSEKPLVMQATVTWAKELEFGLTFKRIQPQEANQLQRLLKQLLDGAHDSGIPARQYAMRAQHREH